MGNIEAHLDMVFEEAAKSIQSRHTGKVLSYRLYDDSMCNLIKEGKCTVTSCTYNRSLDCNVYDITDIDTGEKISAHQFRLELE